MTTDTQIANLQQSAAPLTYTIPGGTQIRVKAVHASFDGSGAAGTFLPTVQLVSDSGHVIATAADQAVSVASGGSADASFFPGVKHAPASSAGVAVHPWIRRILRTGGPLSISSGAGSTTISYDHLDGSDDVFTFFAANGTDGIDLLQDGLYGVLVVMAWTPGHIGFVFSPVLNFASGGGNYNDWNGNDPATASSTDPMPHGFYTMKRLPSGATLRLDVHQDSGAAKNLNTAYMEVTYLGSFTGQAPFSENPNY